MNTAYDAEGNAPVGRLGLKASDYYNKPKGGVNAGTIGNIAAGAGEVAGGILSGGTGFLIAGAIQIGSGILSALTAKPDEPALTPEQMEFQRMLKYYEAMGKRAAITRGAMVALGSTPEKANAALGFRTNKEMIKKYPYQSRTAVATPAPTAATAGRRRVTNG